MVRSKIGSNQHDFYQSKLRFDFQPGSYSNKKYHALFVPCSGTVKALHDHVHEFRLYFVNQLALFSVHAI